MCEQCDKFMFIDDEGNEVEMMIVGSIGINERDYVLMQEEGSDEVVLFRVTEAAEGTEFETIDDEDEFTAVTEALEKVYGIKFEASNDE